MSRRRQTGLSKGTQKDIKKFFLIYFPLTLMIAFAAFCIGTYLLTHRDFPLQQIITDTFNSAF